MMQCGEHIKVEIFFVIRTHDDDITHTGVTTTDTANLTRTGGLCGAIVSTDASTYSTVKIEDCLNTGMVISEIANAINYGDIYGHVYNNTHITLTDVYATDESCSEPGGNSTGNTTTIGSITRGFDSNDITGFSGYIKLSGLSYSNEYLPDAANGVWVAVEDSHPVLTSFSEGYTLVDFAPFVLEGNQIAEMVDSGAGNAVITVSNNDSFYNTYIEEVAGENGHFIVHDSGEKPVIDAWIISHGDVDHYGILKYINDSDGDGVCDDFYVDGIYFTEPSVGICEATNKESTSFAKIIRNSAKQFRTSSNEVAKLYLMYTGQTYYFDGAMAFIMNTYSSDYVYSDLNRVLTLNNVHTIIRFHTAIYLCKVAVIYLIIR